MSLEILLLTSIVPQLIAATGWSNIDPWSAMGNTISTAFRLRFAEWIVNKLNTSAVVTPVNILEMYLDIQSVNQDTNWSDIMTQAYIFFQSGGYVPPVPGIGAPVQINAVNFLQATPPTYNDKDALGERRIILQVTYTFL